MSAPCDWLIGAADFCDIRVDNPKVSGRHAVLREHDGRYWLFDQGSSNGTWLRGERLAAIPVEAAVDDHMSFGTFPLTIRELLALRREPAGTHVVVGASPDCDIRLDSPKVSSRHARLSTCGARTWITDLDSSNGTLVSGQRVQRRDLQPGDMVSLGSQPFDWQAALRTQTATPAVSTASWIIGSAETVDIRIDAPMVSGRHARLSQADDGAWWIEDLGSSNGVLREGRRVKAARLPQEGHIGLGSHLVDVNWLIAQTQPAGQAQPVVERPSPRLPEHRPATELPSYAATDLPVARRRMGAAAIVTSLAAVLALAGGATWLSRGVPKPPRPAPSPSPLPPVVPPAPSAQGWQSAWTLLKETTRAAAAPDEGQQILGAMALDQPSTTPAQRFRPPEQVLDFLREHEQARADFDHRRYGKGLQSSATVGGTQAGSATVPAGDFVVPNLGKLPVRNQFHRGTCAAFAGIGNIEAAVLKASPDLATVDLSEQRFYWMAKPECKSGECGEDQEGSNTEKGFSISRTHRGLDIATEQDCTYVPEFHKNDTQIPQPETCSHGVADVRKEVTIRSLQGLVDALHKYQLPIPIGTRLSSNWEKGEGLITLAGSGTEGQTRHSGGHGYLVVGYRRLPNLPDEGGMCFVVRNSWGRGWGPGGYRCVTQAWLDTFWDDKEAHVVTDVELGPELGGSKPPPPPPDEPPVPVTPPTPNPVPKPPVPVTPPGPKPREQRAVHLTGPNGRAHAGIWQAAGDDAQISLPWQDGSAPGAVKLKQKNRQLFQDDVAVGRIDGELLYLCSGPFAGHCALEATTQTPHQLRIVVATAHAAPRFGSTGKAQDWLPVVATPDGGKLEARLGGVGAKSDVRIRLRYVPAGGVPTPEVDLALQDGRLLFGGRAVGSIRPEEAGLCTGPWASACEWFGSEDGLVLLRKPAPTTP